jgi:hypothetical protein
MPQQIGQGCRLANDTVRLTSPATIALEEVASIYWNGGSVWRATAADMSNLTSPTWNAASDGRDFDSLTFTYYDMNDHIAQPTTLAARLSVVRIDTAIFTRSEGLVSVCAAIRLTFGSTQLAAKCLLDLRDTDASTNFHSVSSCRQHDTMAQIFPRVEGVRDQEGEG